MEQQQQQQQQQWQQQDWDRGQRHQQAAILWIWLWFKLLWSQPSSVQIRQLITTIIITTGGAPLSPLSPPLLMILWQAKLAELKKQNKELEKRMKLMAHQYGRLIDRLSDQSNVLWNISRSIYKWNNRHWNGVADNAAPAVLCHPNYQRRAWLVV